MRIQLAALLLTTVCSAQSKVTPLFAKDLSGLAGKEGTMTTVEYGPGASSPMHRHNSYIFVYVLEGSVKMQVKGGPLKTLKQGETFYESPSDIHTVSGNASETQPAKILVFAVKDKGTPGTIPLK